MVVRLRFKFEREELQSMEIVPHVPTGPGGS